MSPLAKFFKRRKKQDAAPAVSAPPVPDPAPSPGWHANLVLICEKCGKKLDPKANPTPMLKDSLKKSLVAEGLWGTTRVVTTSCLDICPEGKIAVAFLSDRKGT